MRSKVRIYGKGFDWTGTNVIGLVPILVDGHNESYEDQLDIYENKRLASGKVQASSR